MVGRLLCRRTRAVMCRRAGGDGRGRSSSRRTQYGTQRGRDRHHRHSTHRRRADDPLPLAHAPSILPFSYRAGGRGPGLRGRARPTPPPSRSSPYRTRSPAATRTTVRAKRGVAPFAVEIQRRLGSRLRNHLRRIPEPKLSIARVERRHEPGHVLTPFHAPEPLGRFQHTAGDPA